MRRTACASSFFFLLTLLAPRLSSQTFVVDAANGPGAHFTDIAAAIAAVPDGAVLVVRPGNYSPFAIAGKALTILGRRGSSRPTITSPVVSAISVSNTSAGQAVTLASMALGSNVSLQLDNCRGLVHCDEMTASSVDGMTRARNSAQVNLTRCILNRPLVLESCSTVVIECTIRGHNGYTVPSPLPSRCPHAAYPGTPGITVTQGTLTVRGGWITGGSGVFDCFGVPLGPYPAISSSGAVRILDGSIVATGLNLLSRSGPLLSGPGPFRIDPETMLLLDPGGTIGAPFTSEPMPSLVSNGTDVGGRLSATVLDPAGELAVILIGLPGPPTVVAGLVDAFWLDPSFYLFFAIGQAPLTATHPVPNQPALLGFRLAWQAVTADPASGALRVSNPGIGLVW